MIFIFLSHIFLSAKSETGKCGRGKYETLSIGPMSKKAKVLIAVAATLFLALAGMAAYFLIFFRFVRVPTGSMANTIVPGDRVLCRMHVGEIKRGDIALFKLPTDPKVMYMHRVIGLPGETIQVKGRRVLINGKELPEERALVRLASPEEPESSVVEVESKPVGAQYRVYYDIEMSLGGDEFETAHGMKYGAAEPYRIPQGHYFLLGDSRNNSLDSRFYGTVPREFVVGKAITIVASGAKGNEERLFKPLK
jgi:signal peptidase I